jgi:hypothetical protein
MFDTLPGLRDCQGIVAVNRHNEILLRAGIGAGKTDKSWDPDYVSLSTYFVENY